MKVHFDVFFPPMVTDDVPFVEGWAAFDFATAAFGFFCSRPPLAIRSSILAAGRPSRRLAPSWPFRTALLQRRAASLALSLHASATHARGRLPTQHWAADARRAGAIIASGSIVVESNVKKVQHPTGGVVAEILVREGSRVGPGDLLIRLDATAARASLAAVTKSLWELTTRQVRLEAERDGVATLSFPEDLLNAATAEPEIQRIVTGERSRGRLLANGAAFLSQHVIRAINVQAMTCLHTNPGEYRPCEVGVGGYQPPPFYRMPAAMDEFVNVVNRH